MINNLETHNKRYFVRDTAVEQLATRKYFTGKQFRKFAVSELFKQIYNGQVGQFLLSIDINQTTNEYTVKLSPVQIEKADDITPFYEETPTECTKKTIANWEINCDGWYPYCSNCKQEPARAEKKLPSICPNCGAYMENTDKFNH